MKESNHKKSINIAIKSILDSMYSGREEIFTITEQIYKENRQTQANIQKIKDIIKNYSLELEEIKIKEKNSREKLSLVSSDFNNYTHEDIKKSYEESLELQELLINKQSEINKILENLESSQTKVKANESLVKKADELLNRIEIMSDYIKLDISENNKEDENKNLFSRWILFQENEKSRIARDIHDGPAQTMASLVIKSDIIKKLMQKNSPDQTIYNELDQLKIQLRNVISEIRKIMYDLRPTSLDEIGFLPSINGLISKIKQEHKINFTIKSKENAQINNSTIKIICFRIVQESLNNIVKHSQAKNVVIDISIEKKTINIKVKDDGIGFNTRKLNSNNSFGLSSLKERVSIANGIVKINSTIGKGTQIIASIPNMEEQYA